MNKHNVGASGTENGRSGAESNPGMPASGMAGIVSSAHLATGQGWHSSEFEFGLIVAWNAFSKWCVRCMAAAQAPGLAITDVLLLHHISHRARRKKLADICFVLNYEDTHVVSYSLRKLVGLGLAAASRSGKEVFYATTPAGEKLVQRYREIRNVCLVPNIDPDFNVRLEEVARALRTMSGFYDQAARSASSL